LFIDAGTNGELVVGNKEWLMTCACSAGPAFEGSGITCGMPASEGAIEKVELDKSGDVHYKVIGRINPRGLCGSGLVDLLAELFIHGYLDRHGKFKEPKASQRMVDSEEGLAFVVVEGKKSFWGKDLILTERDIANLIRTKGAIYSACSLLLKNVGLPYDKIDALYIAGGFGQHLNIENAIRIGLLPDLERDRFYYIGNSSLLGAYLILLSDKNKDLANVIAQRMTYVELNTEPSYMNEFTGSLFLPHTDINQFPSVKRIFENKS
ncbi:MAG: ATP-binding protein, partial [Candidatus Aminicenantes bacterium]|nr:ATP-binding protein [Candidatus Aminicenantes bacterium]